MYYSVKQPNKYWNPWTCYYVQDNSGYIPYLMVKKYAMKCNHTDDTPHSIHQKIIFHTFITHILLQTSQFNLTQLKKKKVGMQ